MAKLLSLEDIGKFGVRAEDDGLHPVNPEDETWNESYFFDWYDEEGTNAGHCRIGLLSGEDRLWFWLFLYDGTGWVAIEEPRLPLSAFDTETRSLDRNGLRFSLSTTEPLLRARLKVEGFGRVVSGPSNGRIVPIGLDVDATAAGAAHSLGQHEMRGHADESYSTSRYEQAITAEVTQRIGDKETRFEARGERDHSWGPRLWEMSWHFLVGGGEDFRFQSTVVLIHGHTLKLGYLSREDTVNLKEVSYDLTYFDDDPEKSVEGTYRLEAEDGTIVSGRLEPISGVEIDLSHSLPTQPHIYRRTLVRLHPDDGGPPFVGWMEINRMLA